jgi:hypothetical protein
MTSDVKSIFNDESQIIIKQIVQLFLDNVKGRSPDVTKQNQNHDGRKGHWLETQMGILHNSKNDPDIYGYEMKNNTTSKTTFGDWSPNYYIFKDENYFSKDKRIINRDKFMRIFGGPSKEYEGRYSWSGACAPKINRFNNFGQTLLVDRDNNILAVYSYSKDMRPDKKNIVPLNMQKDDLILARWDMEHIKNKLERKFNKLGWFKCEIDKSTGIYTSIVFGGPIKFSAWIRGVKNGLIYFDTGMHIGNNRPYSNWRADNKYWDSLINARY